jgi:hypothetical protein
MALLAAVPAGAEVTRCETALARAQARYEQGVLRALGRCEARVAAGTLSPGTDCHADPVTMVAIGRAATKAGAGITKSCCGGDRVCGTPDDDAPATVGWGAVCPNFANGACTNAIASPADVATCLACVGAGAVDQVVDVVYGRMRQGAAGDAPDRCRAAMGKAVGKFVGAKTKALAGCWSARARGKHTNACPDPGDGKAAAAIARATATLRASICAACGGLDGACGGGDDLTPADVGFVAECPAVDVPGGGSCAAPIGTLDDLAGCIGCIAEFSVDCADRVAVPAFATYPAECNPPPGTCSPGVMCDTSFDCPAGYTCRDNGAGVTRYCVGPSCTVDGECTGGAVCRQFCTVSGCEPRQCQCPGFGCAGPDQLCLDDGGLACRLICLQDSDCVDPFGFVCVNPGFGFGVCIGSLPCQ